MAFSTLSTKLRVASTACGTLAMLATGCASIPQGAASVDSIDIDGNRYISSSDIEEKLATTPSPKFLGLFRGVIYDYQLFDRTVLQRDIERIERYYRARGYYEARVRAGRVKYRNDKHVHVSIDIEEGPVVRIAGRKITGVEDLDDRTARAVKRAVDRSLTTKQPFEEEEFRNAEERIHRALTSHGYAWAKVKPNAEVDLAKHEAQLHFAVDHGPKAKFGSITIEGLGDLPEAPVRRALDINEGDTYSSTDLDSAQQAVLDLGTFSSVEIKPALKEPPPNSAVVPLHVVVQRQKLKSVVLGGGAQLDSIRAQLHLRAGWEHKNLWGNFRNFNVDFKPTFDLYPTRLPTLQAPKRVLPGERLRATLRRPGFIEARTNATVTSELNTYPVLLSALVDETAPVIGYLEYKGSAGLDRTIWKFFGSTTYNFQYNLPFVYTGKLDDSLKGIVISYVDLLNNLDLRNKKTSPHKGVYLQNDFQFAGIGGNALDLRIQPEARGYIPVGRKVTIALRATIGFLLPINYAGGPNRAPNDRDAVTRDLQLIYLRGFFSGGPSSNRGYPLRGVGPHGSVPFYSPDLQAAAIANACNSNSPDYDAARCGVPLGGLSLWEASVEVRFPIAGPVNGTTFCDASDVSRDKFSLRAYPHLSCGLGVRYDTPIGPVRLDVGYRIPGAQFPSSADRLVEGEPATILGAPLAFAFGIGEAF